MEEQRETGGSEDSMENRGGVRHITDELLLKVSGCRSLSLVRSLSLSSVMGNKPIKFIDNLHGCQRLEILKLNHNVIERMDGLSRLTQLKELQLSHNNIQRIEGLEVMSRLQHLNLSHNRIKHIPVWFGRKLHSLHTLHLQHNLITSLYEVSRLRSLSSLSELTVSGNPACSLQNSRLFLLYHLRTLDKLDNSSITPEERGQAHQHFSTEELERLQHEVDDNQSEQSMLRREMQAAVTQLHQQEETNRALTAQIEKQQHTHTLLEHELHTKSQLWDKMSTELTQASCRLYELEQEWAFYKSDARLRPLPSCSTQEVDSGAESPHISKARPIRNTVTSSSASSSSSSSSSSSTYYSYSSSTPLQTHNAIHTNVEASPPLLNDCRSDLSRRDDAELQSNHQTEQLPVAEQDSKRFRQEVQCSLLQKLSVLEQLRDAAEQTQRLMDKQTGESSRTEREIEELEGCLLKLELTDSQHAYLTDQVSSSRLMLDKMSREKIELEDRLSDMLSRIAMETQEIKELEQQLTDSQILANEALQRHLEGIIYGLQESLRGLKEQARHAQQQVHFLQAENHDLRLLLEDTQSHRSQLENTVRTHIQDMSVQQEELCVLRMETQTLRDRQEESSRQQLGLEAELQQLRTELTQQLAPGQVEKPSLQQVVERLQAQLDQTRTHMDQITAGLLDPEEHQSVPEEVEGDKLSPQEKLSRSMARMSRAIQQTRPGRKQLQQDYQCSLEQIARLEAQLNQGKDLITDLEAQVTLGQEQVAQLEAQLICREDRKQNPDLDPEWRQTEELETLTAQLQKSQSRNKRNQQKWEAELEQLHLQLQDVQQERDALLQQQRSQGHGRHRSLCSLNGKLQQLTRSMCESDQLTAKQLWSATEQLRVLNHKMELMLRDSEQDPEHTHAVEELRAELHQAQRHVHTLRQELDSTGTRTRTETTEGRHQRFIPAGHNPPSFGSQGTHDSGLELQYLSSPERGQQQQDRQTLGGRHWVQTPPPITESDQDRRDGTPPVPSAPPAAAVSAAPSDHLLGPAFLLCCPPAGGAALHCNFPEHSTTQVDRCVCDCVHDEAVRLEEEKKKLKLETKQLRRTLRRSRHVVQVCDEVECVERTLLKRRAELRQADRLLLEAQGCISSTREKACSAQQQADVLQRSAEDSATFLTEVIRELREKVEELRRRRQDEEQTLREVEGARRCRDQELTQVSADLCSATDRLAAVLSDCQDSQNHLESLNRQVEQQEQRLAQRKEEHQMAVSRAEELREEEQRLHHRVKELMEQQEALLSDHSAAVCNLTEDEQKLISVQSELQTNRAELKQILLELLQEQQMLEEVKSNRSQSVQQLRKKQHRLDRAQGELERTKGELDRTLDELHRKNAELENMQEEVDRKKAELERKQEEVERKRDELERTQNDVDGRKGELCELQQEVESRRKEVEIHQKESQQRQTDLQQQQQEELSRRREERSSVEEQCKHLEARRRHAERCLSAVEAELNKQREELGSVEIHKQEVLRDTAASQEQLNENAELLSLLGERLEERKKQLQCLEQELSAFSQQRAEQLQELDRQIQHKQAECVEWDNVHAAVCQLEDRRRCLTQQELQADQLKEELLHREEQLQRLGEELLQKEEWLGQMKAELRVKEDVQYKKNEEERSREGAESFYLSTAGLRSAYSTEDERWEAELQREKLRQQEDRLKARLRCSLWSREETLEERQQEAEETLLGLRHRVDQLDSLLTY